MELDELVSRFEACTLPKAEWTHQAHLTVGAWHVHRYGAADAMTRLRRGIRRLNDSHGTANSATSGYHETITQAYVTLLAEYLSRPGDGSLAERVGRLLDSPLAARDALLRFYSRETLASSEARAAVMTPLVPLSLWFNP
ncbi:MAG TPA: hypothetical protein VIY56_13345 [Vicinamibacterales bacterium]